MKKETLELIKEWSDADFTIPELKERFKEELEKIEDFHYDGISFLSCSKFEEKYKIMDVIQFFPDKINVYQAKCERKIEWYNNIISQKQLLEIEL